MDILWTIIVCIIQICAMYIWYKLGIQKGIKIGKSIAYKEAIECFNEINSELDKNIIKAKKIPQSDK